MVIDKDHLFVRALMTQAMLQQVEGNQQEATQEEFRELSRVINKEMYNRSTVGVSVENE